MDIIKNFNNSLPYGIFSQNNSNDEIFFDSCIKSKIELNNDKLIIILYSGIYYLNINASFNGLNTCIDIYVNGEIVNDINLFIIDKCISINGLIKLQENDVLEIKPSKNNQLKNLEFKIFQI
jgi:hypothetical protein